MSPDIEKNPDSSILSSRQKSDEFVRGLVLTRSLKYYNRKCKEIPAYGELIHYLNNDETVSIPFLSFTASGKSAFKEYLINLDAIYNLDDDRELMLIDLSFGALRKMVLEEAKSDTSSSLTDKEWEVKISDRYLDKRRIVIGAILTAPHIFKFWVDTYGPPSNWSQTDEDNLVMTIHHASKDAELLADAKQDFCSQYRIKVLEELPIMTFGKRMIFNKVPLAILKESQQSIHTRPAVIFPDPDIQDYAMKLRGFFSDRRKTVDTLSTEEIRNEFPGINITQEEIRSFAEKQWKSAPAHVIAVTYFELENMAKELLNIDVFATRSKLLTYMNNLPNSAYVSMSPENQKRYKLYDAFLQWYVMDVCGCKDAFFIYNRFRKHEK